MCVFFYFLAEAIFFSLQKLQLKSDRDKEIEEFFAQLNKKYELKHQEEESNFLSKKKEFDERHNRVLMNKILAEAFRTKCMEIRSTGKSVMQQGANFLAKSIALAF